MRYLKKAWYVAGFSEELVAGALLARTLLEQPVVFFRTAEGGVKALADRCPHRFAPLSMGRLMPEGDLECPYHGLRFNGAGACTRNPHGDGSIPKAAQVRAYQVVERHGLLWWWAGEADEADDTRIPDYSFAQRAHPDATVKGYMPTDCDYQLLVDNILDLTHADYLHGGSLGSGAITRVMPKVTDLGDSSVAIAWHSVGDLAPPAFDMHLKRQGQPTDQWTEVTWTAPATMRLHVGATLLGEPREAGFDSENLHLVTPESAGRCHYWFWTTRNVAISPQANEVVTGVVKKAFSQEDKPMLEAQQRRMGPAEFWSLKPVLLAGDAGAVRARRKLAALIDAESTD